MNSGGSVERGRRSAQGGNERRMGRGEAGSGPCVSLWQEGMGIRFQMRRKEKGNGRGKIGRRHLASPQSGLLSARRPV